MGWFQALTTAATAAAPYLQKQKTDTRHLRRGIQWRVNDAKAAGVHPLYALGANISSPTVSVGGNGPAAAAAALGGAGRGYSDKRFADAQMGEITARTKAANAQAERDFAAAQEISSRVSRSGQSMNYSQDIPQVMELLGPQGGKHRTSKSSSQQTVEDQYGGALGELYGIYRYINDYMLAQPREYHKRDTRRLPPPSIRRQNAMRRARQQRR